MNFLNFWISFLEFFITLPELKEIQIDYEKYKDSISTILYHFILYKTGDIYDYIMYNLLDFEEDEEDEEDEEEYDVNIEDVNEDEGKLPAAPAPFTPAAPLHKKRKREHDEHDERDKHDEPGIITIDRIHHDIDYLNNSVLSNDDFKVWLFNYSKNTWFDILTKYLIYTFYFPMKIKHGNLISQYTGSQKDEIFKRMKFLFEKLKK